MIGSGPQFGFVGCSRMHTDNTDKNALTGRGPTWKRDGKEEEEYEDEGNEEGIFG